MLFAIDRGGRVSTNLHNNQKVIGAGYPMSGSGKLEHNADFPMDSSPPADVARLRDELADLADRQGKIDAILRDAALRQRYGRDPESIAKAKEDEQRHLVLLDRLMTRIRAVEAKLLLRKRQYH